MIKRQAEIKEEIEKLLFKLECSLKYDDIENCILELYHNEDYVVCKNFNESNIIYLAISKGSLVLMTEARIYCGNKDDVMKYIELRHEYFINNLIINDIRNIYGESYHERYKERLKNDRNKVLKAMEEI